MKLQLATDRKFNYSSDDAFHMHIDNVIQKQADDLCGWGQSCSTTGLSVLLLLQFLQRCVLYKRCDESRDRAGAATHRIYMT